jgi:hypothetical protein
MIFVMPFGKAQFSNPKKQINFNIQLPKSGSYTVEI